MPRVVPRTAIQYNNSAVKAGFPVDVPRDVQEEWSKKGLLYKPGEETEQERMRRQLAGVTAEPRVVTRAVLLPVTPAQYKALQTAGLDSPEKLAAVTDEELMQVEGISESAAARIRQAVGYADVEGGDGDEGDDRVGDGISGNAEDDE